MLVISDHILLYKRPSSVTVFRVVAEVASLGTSNELLYSTEFVVFIFLND